MLIWFTSVQVRLVFPHHQYFKRLVVNPLHKLWKGKLMSHLIKKWGIQVELFHGLSSPPQSCDAPGRRKCSGGLRPTSSPSQLVGLSDARILANNENVDDTKCHDGDKDQFHSPTTASVTELGSIEFRLRLHVQTKLCVCVCVSRLVKKSRWIKKLKMKPDIVSTVCKKASVFFVCFCTTVSVDLWRWRPRIRI